MAVPRTLGLVSIGLLAASILVQGSALSGPGAVAPLAPLGLALAALSLAAALLARFLPPGSSPRTSTSAALASSPIAVAAAGSDGNVTGWSRGAEALFGLELDAVRARGLGALVASGEEDAFLASARSVLETRNPAPPRPVTLTDARGRRFRALAVLFPIARDPGLGEVGCAFIDVSRLDAIGDERRDTVFDAGPAGLLHVDAEGRIAGVNRTLADWVGRRAESLEGADVGRSEVLPHELRDALRQAASPRGGVKEAIEREATLVTAGGRVRPVHAVIAPRRDGGADAVLVDGTSRQRLLAERDAARAAVAAARQVAAETIESTTRDLESSVKEIVAAAELAQNEGSGPIARAAAAAELERTGRRLLEQVTRRETGAHRAVQAVPRALLVDDNDENRELIAHMLRSRGVEVTAVGSGREAIDVAARAELDFVLLDVQMPEMDGYEVVRRLRALPGGGALPVVALTALTSESVRSQCLEEGMDDFVSKPVTLARVAELVQRWGRRGDPGALPADPVQHPVDDDPGH